MLKWLDVVFGCRFSLDVVFALYRNIEMILGVVKSPWVVRKRYARKLCKEIFMFWCQSCHRLIDSSWNVLSNYYSPDKPQPHLAQCYSRRMALMLNGVHESKILKSNLVWISWFSRGWNDSPCVEMFFLNRFSHRGAKFSKITGSLYQIGSR